MQPQSRGLRAECKKRVQLALLTFQYRHPVLHAGLIHSVFDCCHDAADLLVDLHEITTGLLARGIRAGGIRVEGAAVFLDEGGDQIRMQQAVAQTGQDAIFNNFALDSGAVGADRSTLVTCCDAAIPGLVDQRIAGPAAATLQQP